MGFISCPRERHILPLVAVKTPLHISASTWQHGLGNRKNGMNSLNSYQRITLPCVFSNKQIFPAGLLPRTGVLVSPSLSTWGWQLYFKLVATELNCGEKRLKINMFSYLPHDDTRDYAFHQGQQDMSGSPKKGNNLGEALQPWLQRKPPAQEHQTVKDPLCSKRHNILIFTLFFPTRYPSDTAPQHMNPTMHFIR